MITAIAQLVKVEEVDADCLCARRAPQEEAVGRGPGTGHQKTSGRGTKGQGKAARSETFHFEG
jgi:hypothetical protein